MTGGCCSEVNLVLILADWHWLLLTGGHCSEVVVNTQVWLHFLILLVHNSLFHKKIPRWVPSCREEKPIEHQSHGLKIEGLHQNGFSWNFKSIFLSNNDHILLKYLCYEHQCGILRDLKMIQTILKIYFLLWHSVLETTFTPPTPKI
jgi:hypothetical protein